MADGHFWFGGLLESVCARTARPRPRLPAWAMAYAVRAAAQLQSPASAACAPPWLSPPERDEGDEIMTLSERLLRTFALKPERKRKHFASKVRSIQTCFTHRPVSTLDRVSFRLTGELFLYGTTLRREAAAARRSHGECAVGQARPAGRRTFRFVFHPPRTF